jgi:hypothetical protein
VFSCNEEKPLFEAVYAEALLPNTITIRFDLGNRCTTEPHKVFLMGLVTGDSSLRPIRRIETNVVSVKSWQLIMY